MVFFDRDTLLSHPLCQNILSQKWWVTQIALFILQMIVNHDIKNKLHRVLPPINAVPGWPAAILGGCIILPDLAVLTNVLLHLKHNKHQSTANIKPYKSTLKSLLITGYVSGVRRSTWTWWSTWATWCRWHATWTRSIRSSPPNSLMMSTGVLSTSTKLSAKTKLWWITTKRYGHFFKYGAKLWNKLWIFTFVSYCCSNFKDFEVICKVIYSYFS